MSIFSQYKGLRKEIYILFICKLIDNMGSMVGPMLTLILSIKLGLNAQKIALIGTIFMLLSLPTSILGGKIADRFNKKILVNIMDISSAIIYIFCGIIGINIYTIIIYYVGSLIQAAESPTYESLLADFTSSSDRDRASSLMYWGLNLGLMLSPTLGGLLLENHLQLLFIISGVAQLLSIVVFDIFVKDITPVVDHNNVYENKSDATNTLKLLITNPVITAFIITLAIGSTVYNMWGYIMPLTLTKVVGENSSLIYGTMNSLNCIVVVLFTAPITSLFIKYDSFKRIILSISLQIIGFALFILFINKTYMYYVAIFIFTIGEILNTITTTPHITKRIPMNYRGRILATSDFMFYFFNALGQIIVGTIFDNKGIYITWIIIIGMGLLTMISFALIKNPDKKRYPNLYQKN